ncbi:hypothetical protein [Nocardioides lianchengensis]|uniref:ABC-2 type transport system permease protein n=1 Tax=Nocardioides lianchengensis TaxID=1045774 RepID=A0A1G6SA04_9ACTN|nr:hypothetical protein [Nocardioides lianchengensis]NYG09768.1 hypothetical protein [Nocardioides lianchengensis]SDD13760.1 hypothetical protein SAMN05421872_10677 [Nocardioides lianchengensis]
MNRVTLWLMIPLNLLLCGWVWIGRLVFGVGGWFMLILFPVVLILLVMLIVTTVLAFTQDGSPKELTVFQTLSQLTLWFGLFVLGAVMPDFGDADDSMRSGLTQLFGYSDSLYDLSFLLAVVAAVASLVAWVTLLVSLTAGRRRLAT